MAKKLFFLILLLFLPGCMPRLSFDDAPTSTAKAVALEPVLYHSAKTTPVIEAKHSLTVVDFLPLEQIFFRYSTIFEQEKSFFDVHVEYIDSETYSVQHRLVSQDSSTVEILRCEDGKLFRYWVGSGITYTHNFTKNAPNDDEILLMEPIEVGTEWKVSFGVRKITAVDKPIHVRAGAFNAVEVQTIYDDNVVCTQYYLPGMGLLQEITTDSNSDSKKSSTWVLETLFREKELDFPQKVTFYFADIKNNAIKNVTRDLIFELNESVERKFEAELRNNSVPGSSGLLPLPPNAKIISTKLAKDSFTIDFSHELLDDIDLDINERKLFMQAIANTFSDYYDVHRTKITIEGHPQGEYIFNPTVLPIN